MRFLPKVPGGKLAAAIKAAPFTPRENALFSLQNLRARSNKEAKDQTTKNSLESEFSVPRPQRGPWGGGGGWPPRGDRVPSWAPVCCCRPPVARRGSRERAGRLPGLSSALLSSSNLAGGSYRPFFQMMRRV